MHNFKPFTVSVLIFALACERIFIETHSIENRCYRTRKYTVCGSVPASFSPDIFQAGAVTGLMADQRSVHEAKDKFRIEHFNCVGGDWLLKTDSLPLLWL